MTFAKDGFVIARSWVPKKVCDAIATYAKSIEKTGDLKDNQVPNTPSFYGDRVMETLQLELLPKVEKITNLKLFPTYAYFRIYKKGDTLAIHRDRPSCEISLTLTISNQGGGDKSWPIYIQSPDGKKTQKVYMNAGDAVVYRGCDCNHWREKYKEGTQQIQTFLHYVDQHGPYASHKFDGRKSLNV